MLDIVLATGEFVALVDRIVAVVSVFVVLSVDYCVQTLVHLKPPLADQSYALLSLIVPIGRAG